MFSVLIGMQFRFHAETSDLIAAYLFNNSLKVIKGGRATPATL